MSDHASRVRLPAVRRLGARLLAAAALAGATAARGDLVLPIPMTADAEASIKLSTPCPQPPRFGFAPVRVSIENSATRERSWQIDFEAGSGDRTTGPVTYSRTFTVPAGQARETWVYVPIAEPGDPSGAPTANPNGLTAGAGSNTGGGANTRVYVSKTPTGTRVVVTRMAGTRLVATEQSDIDEATGELTRTFATPGPVSSSRSSTMRPPSSMDVTYHIDNFTGNISPAFSRSAAGSKKVTITQGSSGPTSPPAVTITPTPIGTKVTRTISLSGGRSIVEEREIDKTTGVMTTTRTGRGSPPSATTTPPVPNGSMITHTIDAATGLVRSRMTSGGPLENPPKVVIVTENAPAAAGAAKSIAQSYSGAPMTLAAQVFGPGVALTSRVQFPALSNDANMRPIAATPMLERWLEEGLKAEGIRTPNLAALEPTQLPPDWRVWSSFTTVLLQADEFATLDVARRGALREWVSLGGRLLLFPGQPGEGNVESVGAGEIVTAAKPLTQAPKAADFVELRIKLGGTPGYPDRADLEVPMGSTLDRKSQRVQPSTVWISLLLVGFALMVGPVNLFFLAPASKRHRLFVTTPVISLVAAMILVGVIFVQDGIGGEGVRRALVVLVPGANEAAIVQEQAARTGFLARQGFAIPEDVQLTNLPFAGDAMAMLAPSSSAFTRDESHAAGDWFRSRSRQAHLLQRIAPTRARVEQVGTFEGAPVVQSTFGSALHGFVLVAADGTLWTAADVAPGTRVTLTKGGMWYERMPLGATKRFSDLLMDAAQRAPGRWMGRLDSFELAPIETSRSIRWSSEEIIVTGVLDGQGEGKEEAR